MRGTFSLLTGKDLYSAAAAVTRVLDFCDLIRTIIPFSQIVKNQIVKRQQKKFIYFYLLVWFASKIYLIDVIESYSSFHCNFSNVVLR